VDPRAGSRLFVYGALRSGREAGQVLSAYTLERTSGARVRGGIRRGRGAWPRAVFDDSAETLVVGDLLELDPARCEEALAECARRLGNGFRLVAVEVEVGENTTSAHALEWSGDLDEPRDYLGAARSNLKIAHYHCHALAQLGQDDPYERIMFQAHADGVVGCGTGAVDDLVCALDLILGYHLLPATLESLLVEAERRAEVRCSETLGILRDCAEDPILRDAREVLVRPVRYVYEQTPRGWHWTFDEVEVRGSGEPYSGPRSVLAYCVKFLARLEAIEEAVGELRSAPSPEDSESVEVV
jgi:hypothetical protein